MIDDNLIVNQLISFNLLELSINFMRYCRLLTDVFNIKNNHKVLTKNENKTNIYTKKEENKLKKEKI